jgi:arylsulfatase A-like enzyme
MLEDYFDWGAFSAKSEITLPQKLRTAGYMTYAVGKWHLGSSSWATTPTGRGFHRFFGAYANADHFDYCSKAAQGWHFDLHYQEDYTFAGGSTFAESSYLNTSRPLHRFQNEMVGQYSTEVYDRHAREFMNDHKRRFPDKPFFLYYAMSAMHHPLEAPDRYFEKCPQAAFPNENRQHACAMAVAVDVAIQNLTLFMESSFGDSHYVVVITSDNGGPAWSKTSGGSNYPLRGSKGEIWEGGVRNHALVWGSHPDLETAKGSTYTGGFMHLVDWHATLAHLAGVAGSNTHGKKVGDIDGYSMWEALISNSPSPREELLIHYSANGEIGELIGLPSHNELHIDMNEPRPYCKSGKRGKPMMAYRSKQWKLLFNVPHGEKCGGWWDVRNTTNEIYLSGMSGQPLYFSPDTNAPILKDIHVAYRHANHLFDLESDPAESRNLAANHPEIVQRLTRRALDVYGQGRISRGCDSYSCGGNSCCENPSCCNTKKHKTMFTAFEVEGANIPGNPCHGTQSFKQKALALYPWFDRR